MSSSPDLPLNLPVLPPDPAVSQAPADRVVSDKSLSPTARAVERFWKNVVCGPGDRCWIWCGPISTPDGYGRFTWQAEGRRRTVSAHRFALMLTLGDEIPRGVIGEHYCCEPLCVRVDSYHLREATQSENIGWAVHRGRHVGSAPGAGSQQRARRSQLVRAAVTDGWDDEALQAARDLVELDKDQMRLW